MGLPDAPVLAEDDNDGDEIAPESQYSLGPLGEALGSAWGTC
jgi:hypothetical protein